MTESDRSVAEHVAFVAERAWVEDVQRVFASDTADMVPPATEVLARWWQARNARLDAALLTFTAELRAELSRALAADRELQARLPAAGTSVRRVASAGLERVAPRLSHLRALNAPAVVLDRQLRTCAEALDALDPRAPWQSPAPPSTGTLRDSVSGKEVPDLHAWLGNMLSAAHADRANVGLGVAFDTTPESVQFQQQTTATLPEPPSWAGFEYTTMSVQPDPTFWCSPRVTLPHLLCARADAEYGQPGRWVVAESSGPVSYALAADRDGLPSSLHAALAAVAARLNDDEALVSFVWLATPTSGPWRSY